MPVNNALRVIHRLDIDAGAYLVMWLSNSRGSRCRDPAVAERLWDETDKQIKALAKY